MKHLEKVKLWCVTDNKTQTSKWILAHTSLLAKIYFTKKYPESKIETIDCIDMSSSPSSDYECFYQDHLMGTVEEIEATGYLSWGTKDQHWKLEFYPKSQ